MENTEASLSVSRQRCSVVEGGMTALQQKSSALDGRVLEALGGVRELQQSQGVLSLRADDALAQCQALKGELGALKEGGGYSLLVSSSDASIHPRH
jgi:hypothetical protein